LLASSERSIGSKPHGLALQPLGDTSDPEDVLRDCSADHQDMRRVLSG
jgi:hypothetical protein